MVGPTEVSHLSLCRFDSSRSPRAPRRQRVIRHRSDDPMSLERSIAVGRSDVVSGFSRTYNGFPMPWRRVLLSALALALLATNVTGQRRGGGGSSGEALSFRFVGPVVGNRVASVA